MRCSGAPTSCDTTPLLRCCGVGGLAAAGGAATAMGRVQRRLLSCIFVQDADDGGREGTGKWEFRKPSRSGIVVQLRAATGLVAIIMDGLALRPIDCVCCAMPPSSRLARLGVRVSCCCELLLVGQVLLRRTTFSIETRRYHIYCTQ